MNDISRWLSATFEHLRAQGTNYIVPELIVSLLALPITFGMLGISVLIFGGAVVGADLSSMTDRPETLLALVGVFFAALVMTMIVASVFLAPLTLRYFRGCLSLMRGGSFGVGDLFRGPGDVGRSMVLAALLITANLFLALLLYLPVVLVGVFLLFAFPAMADRQVGPVEACKISYRLVRPRYWSVLGYWMLTWMISSLVGSIPVVGSLAMLIVMNALIVVPYEDLRRRGEG